MRTVSINQLPSYTLNDISLPLINNFKDFGMTSCDNQNSNLHINIVLYTNLYTY